MFDSLYKAFFYSGCFSAVFCILSFLLNKNVFARILIVFLFSIFAINSFIFSRCFHNFSFNYLAKTLLITLANLLISAFLYSYFLKKIVRIKARRNSKNIGKIKKNESKIYRISLAKKRRWGDSAENIYRGAVKKEEDLKQKIKEQKNILKKKIETARKDAYKTRKPEEIKKTEEMIKYIMEKYNLTEETLNEDD